MKLVIAYIKPFMLNKVVLALHDINLLSGVSVSDARGFGRGRAATAPDRITEASLNLLPRIRLEAACMDETVDQVVTTIEQNSHTGRRGDGKIYVVDLDQAVRISTGERGRAAL